MTMEPRPTDVQALEEGKPQNDWESVLQHVKDNPVLWAGSVAFIIVCAIAGSIYRVQRASADKSVTAEFARALKAEEPGERVTALTPLVEKKSIVTAEALYLRGEYAVEAGKLAIAEESFERLRAEYPDFAFTPDAVEGLGFVAEEEKDYETAVAHYEDVRSSWPDSFAARRQPFNIGAAQERSGDIEAAIVSYQKQLDVFPGSNIASRAQQALDRLRESHPALFDGEAEAALGEISDGAVFDLTPESESAERTEPAAPEAEASPETAPAEEGEATPPTEPEQH